MRLPLPWRKWTLEAIAPDWGSLQSAYEHIRTISATSLPDEPEIAASNEIRWAPGAYDGVMGHHGNQLPSEMASTVYERLKELLVRATDERFRRLYTVLKENSCLSYVDSLLERLNANRSSIDFARLHELALYLCKRAPHREPVKAGLALLGISGSEADLSIAVTLGRNDECTLFAAVTAARLSPTPESTLWEMAKAVSGWGRIQIVDRLADTTRADIQQWMLREGFRNSVMDSYSAGICARTGRLHEALAADPIDPELLDSAAGLFRAMLAGGPADTLHDYPEAPQAVEAYVDHVWTSWNAGLVHYLALRDLGKYVEKSTWDETLRRHMIEDIGDILRREKWRDEVESGLKSQEPHEFWLANQAAKELGIDTWDVHFDRLRKAPLDGTDWYCLLEETDDSRIDAVLDFASRAIPLASIATGPASELGLGPGWAAHSVLDFVLQALARFPAKGWHFIEAGVRSPVVRNRNMAIKALAGWPRASWPENAAPLIEVAITAEPDEQVKNRLKKLESGLPID